MNDHSLLYTDRELFPGWDFDVTQEEMIKSPPVTLLQESLIKLSKDERSAFEKAVITKHTKYGAVSLFKGVDEIRFDKMKSIAKNEITNIRKSIDQFETEISELEKQLAESRKTVSRSNMELERLKKEIISIFPQVITPFKDLHYLRSRNNLEYSDLPNDPRLLFNKKYNSLKTEITMLCTLAEECSKNIPIIEEKLGPARHNLAVLLIEEAELKPLDDKLDEINLQEKVEKEIVERFRLDRQEKRIIAANERSRKLKESLEIKKIQEKLLQDQNEEELKGKRKQLMNLLKVEIHKIEEERRFVQEKEIEAKIKKQKALEILNQKVLKLKNKIIPKPQHDFKLGKESEIDVIKRQIYEMKLKSEFEKKKKIKRQEAMEERKKIIMEKLAKENARFDSKKKVIKKVVRFKGIQQVSDEELTPETSKNEIKSFAIEESTLISCAPTQRKRLPPPRHKNSSSGGDDEFYLNGPPFKIPNNSVDFVDYDPSKKYSQKIHIVNISRRVNTFKLVHFPLEYSDIFTLKLDAPGYVNPGMKTKGTIFFHPPSSNFSEDIETKIELLAQWGGKFTIPISCRKKRSVPVFSSVHGPGYKKKDLNKDDSKEDSAAARSSNLSNLTSLKSSDDLVMDFGECTEGDRRSLTVEIINKGALPCEYVVKAPESQFKDYVYELECDRESTLTGYGTMKIKVIFMPGVADHFLEEEVVNDQSSLMTYDFSIEYANGSKLNIGCTGSRAKSSIQVYPKMVDFSLCSVGQTYRERITLINHINISTKIWITANGVEDGLESNVELDRLCMQADRIGDIEIHPSSAFVQSNDPFPIFLSIIPNSKAAKISNNGDSEFELTIRINYLQKDGKKNYTPLRITGRITGNKIILSPVHSQNEENILDFGHVSILECRQLSLKVENTSKALQQVELSSDDPRMIIISDDTTGSNHNLDLQPNSKVIKNVRFEPNCYGPICCNIVAKNKWNQKFKITARGFGLVPPLKFLNDHYVFPETSVGTQKTTIFILKRTGSSANESTDCKFEFGEPFPDPSNQNTSLTDPIIRLTPQRGIFCGKINMPIEVALTPELMPKTIAQDQTSDTVLKEDSEEIVAPFSISYIVPCYLKPHLSEADRMLSFVQGSLPEDSKNVITDKLGHLNECVIYFKISATICLPEIILCDSKDIEIDFGLVPLGEKTVKSFVVRNASDHKIQLKSNGLNPSGGFFLAKALREIGPEQTFEIKIGFKPDSTHMYREYFELVTPKTTLKVRLDGEGFFPELDMDSCDRAVAFEDTIVGETSVRKIKLWNKKHYPISFIADLSVPETKRQIFSFSNWHLEPAFDVNPKRAIVEANSYLEIDISFKPNCETDNYSDILKLNIKGNNAPLEILLFGRGWESSSFLSGYDMDLESPAAIAAEKNYSNFLKNVTGIDGFLVPDASGKGLIIDEEKLAILAQSPYKKDTYFSTLTCNWKKNESDAPNELWELDLKDIIVMNIKPPGLKLDSGKRATECEYIIEPLEATFSYSTDLNHFVMEKTNALPTDTQFTFDSLKGTVPIDSSLHIKLKLINPIKSYWQEFQEKWSVYGASTDQEDTEGNGTIHPTFQNQMDIIKERISTHHISKPFPIESCFKITLKGGYRYIDPKGPMSPYDARIWILKVVSKYQE